MCGVFSMHLKVCSPMGVMPYGCKVHHMAACVNAVMGRTDAIVSPGDWSCLAPTATIFHVRIIPPRPYSGIARSHIMTVVIQIAAVLMIYPSHAYIPSSLGFDQGLNFYHKSTANSMDILMFGIVRRTKIMPRKKGFRGIRER
jgi:hypothetical protein